MPLLLTLPLLGCSGFFDPTRVSVEGSSAAVEGPVRLVAGSTISVTFARRFSRTLEGVAVVSSAPDVLTVAEHTPSTDVAVAVLTASTPGDARIDLVRDGEPYGSLTVEVRAPDSLLLHPMDPRLLDAELQPPEPRPSLLLGGGTRFLVTWQADGQPLQGYGALAVPEQDGLEVYARAGDGNSLLRDSLIVRSVPDPALPDPTSVFVTAGAVTFEHPLRLRAPEEIASLRLDGPRFRSGFLLHQGFLMAHAVDAAGEVVHGVPVSWQWGSVAFPGEGEVFRYMPGTREDPTRPLVARYGGLTTEMALAGAGGTVLDVTRECAVGPGAGWLGVGIGLLLARRRAC